MTNLGRRTNDPQKTRSEIIEVATREFSEKGLTGARIDEIAAGTRTSKRMIYYYFGSKEGLYAAVLDNAYEVIRLAEAGFDVRGRQPEEALRQLVGVVFDHHLNNEDYVRLVMNENLIRGRFIKQSLAIRNLNKPAISILKIILERGADAGIFRRDVDPIDLHMSIGGLSFFMIANKYTFSTAFDIDMSAPATLAKRRETIIEMILSFVLSPTEPNDRPD